MRQFLAWCEPHRHSPALDQPAVNAFTAALFEQGTEAATARARQRSLRRFSAWLAAEREIERDELPGLRAPKLDQKVTERLADAQLRAPVKAYAGRELREQRDEAIVRFMLETTARADELVAMKTADLDLAAGRATIRRRKGG